MTSCNWQSNCQWCRSFNVITTIITYSMYNKYQDECNQCFNDYTLNRFHMLTQSSQTQIIIQNCIRGCELKYSFFFFKFRIKNFFSKICFFFLSKIPKIWTYFDNSSTACSSQALCNNVNDRFQNTAIATDHQTNSNGWINVAAAYMSKSLQWKKQKMH